MIFLCAPELMKAMLKAVNTYWCSVTLAAKMFWGTGSASLVSSSLVVLLGLETVSFSCPLMSALRILRSSSEELSE